MRPIDRGSVIGTACRYLPKHFRAGEEIIRDLVPVRVTGFDGERLLAEAAGKPDGLQSGMGKPAASPNFRFALPTFLDLD